MGYNTKQGELIFSLLENSGGKHLTAEDISHTLGERGCPVGKATVYRHLERCCATGACASSCFTTGRARAISMSAGTRTAATTIT